MSGTSDSRRGPRPIVDAAAKVAVLAALREGRRLEELADVYGVTAQAFYSARRRDALFDAAWRDAHALSAAAERRLAREEGSFEDSPSALPENPSTAVPAVPLPEQSSGRIRIVSNNRRVLQRRKMRHVRFDEKRQQIFLAHFAWSCDAVAAAAEAGVCERTVYNERRRNPGFAAAFQEALEQGYARLEAEALRQRLAAQQALRAAIEAAGTGAEGAGAETEAGAVAVAAEFERVMKLLNRWDRRNGQVGRREVRHGHQKRMSFDEAIVLLDRKLRALGVRRGIVPPEDEPA